MGCGHGKSGDHKHVDKDGHHPNKHGDDHPNKHGSDHPNENAGDHPNEHAYDSPFVDAHLSTPEADLLAHLQTAPVDSPVFYNLNASPTTLDLDPLVPDVLDSGAHAAEDTASNILDQGVDYVTLLGDSGHDHDMQALLDHLQDPSHG